MLIYLIENVVWRKRYVGKTLQTLPRRRIEHISEARSGRKDTELYRDMRELGADCFLFKVLDDQCTSEEVLNYMERYFIRTIKPEYNVSTGGTGGRQTKLRHPRPRTDEVKNKIRQSLIETIERKRDGRPALAV